MPLLIWGVVAGVGALAGGLTVGAVANVGDDLKEITKWGAIAGVAYLIARGKKWI